MTELEALKSRDDKTQRGAFESLKRDVYKICFNRLGSKFPQEIEDVVIESMTEIYLQVDTLRSSDELGRHTHRIANTNAITRYRKLTTGKRGEGNTLSIQALEESKSFHLAAEATRLSDLDMDDLRRVLQSLQSELKPEYKQALNDFIGEELTHKEISQKRGWPVGTVGANISRGLKAIRAQRLKYPQQFNEAMQYIVMLMI